MGRPKALLPWHGSTFVETVVAGLVEAELDPILVVIGAHAVETRGAVTLSCAEWIDNPDWTTGQAGSLRRGVARLPPDVTAAVVALVDQPQIDSALVQLLVSVRRESGAPVVRPTWNGRGGHPILIGAEVFGRILGAGPDETTFQVLAPFRGDYIDIPVEDDSILIDFDTPEDLSGSAARFDKQS